VPGPKKRDEPSASQSRAETPPLDSHDVALLEQNLRLTPEQRLEKLVAMVRFVEAGREALARAHPRG
jgi:hypothetical protein